MPRFALALLLVPACFFDADYSHAHLKCSDGVCPSGMQCYSGVCGVPDAAVGGSDAHDAQDAHVAALTCTDPGMAMLGSQNGTTAGHANLLSTMCGGVVYNGPDAVYTIAGGRQVTIGISSSAFAPAAYVIGACTQFPTCDTNTAAQPSAPLTITLAAGMHLIVVDGVNANLSGAYTLSVSSP